MGQLGEWSPFTFPSQGPERLIGGLKKDGNNKALKLWEAVWILLPVIVASNVSAAPPSICMTLGFAE